MSEQKVRREEIQSTTETTDQKMKDVAVSAKPHSLSEDSVSLSLSSQLLNKPRFLNKLRPSTPVSYAALHSFLILSVYA